MNRHSRAVVSGPIAQYNQTAPSPGPDWSTLLRNSINVRGFLVADHIAKIPNAVHQVAKLLRDARSGHLTISSMAWTRHHQPSSAC
jgi:hypothetical protein